MTSTDTPVDHSRVVQKDRVVIRFAGDSGDGMQLTGDRFTSETAAFGNDLSTLPNFPAEIRAPAGTLPGVSSFQLHFANYDILTPGDRPDVLVAMNPAALKANIADLPRGGGAHRQHRRVHQAQPHEGRLRGQPARGRLARAVLGAPGRDGHAHPRRARGRPGCPRRTPSARRTCSRWACCRGCTTGRTRAPSGSCGRSSRSRPEHRRGQHPRVPRRARLRRDHRGVRRHLRGRARAPARRAPTARSPATRALAYGIVAAGQVSGLPVFLGSYPITPASDILHELSKHKAFDVTTFQAEDEIAGIGAALGAAFGGALGVTTTSGPGVSLKSETIGLAVALELPLLVVDVQRGGPSTGLPTKTEQADLLQAMFGRNGEAPLPIIAPRSPADCFAVALEAARIAVTYRTPVILLSDGSLANGSEPWRVPDAADAADVRPGVRHRAQRARRLGRVLALPARRRHAGPPVGRARHPRARAPHRRPGEGRRPRRISYEPDNHDRMTRLRAAKIDGIPVPDVEVDDPDGRRRAARPRLGLDVRADRGGRAAGAGAGAQGRHRPPAPPQPAARRTSATCWRVTTRVLVPEMNLGQLVAAAARAATSSTRRATRRSPVCRSRPRSCRTCSWTTCQGVHA